MRSGNNSTMLMSEKGGAPHSVQLENSTRKPGKGAGIIDTIINNCTGLYSDQVAVRYGEFSVTYSDILFLARKVAASIQKNSLSDSPVGLVCSKNSKFVSAWLGGILSGKLFFQVDASWPFQRIDTLLKSVDCHLLIDAAGGGGMNLPAGNDLEILSWEGIIADTKADYSDADLYDGHRSAYILFTSGSTGEPKAVVNSLQSIDHFFGWYIEHYGFDGGDTFSLLSGITHDPVIRDIVTPLLLGAQLVIPTPDDLSSPANLSNFLIDNRVSVVHLTPPMGKILFDLSSVDFCSGSVKHLNFGGDRLPLDLVKKCFNRVPEVQVSNFYGATETPQVMLYNDINDEKLNHYRKKGLVTVPVGVPIPEVEVYLEKEDGMECAAGEEGQIIISSDYLSLGYLHKERHKSVMETETDQCCNVYKTGDYGRQLENGEIECLGRRDRQVKIRGYRIEPVEIENIIRRMDGVKDVVVQKDSGSDELDAFIVSEKCSPDTLAINTHLRNYLPSYIQIKNIFVVGEIRLTPNNKVDFEFLAQCRADKEKKVTVAVQENQGDTTRAVLDIFQEVLSIQRIDAEATLLELGCDSLKSFELVEQINNRLGVQIGTIELYECQTALALARLIETGCIKGADDYWRAEDFINKAGRNRKNESCRFMRKDWLCQMIVSRMYARQSAKLRWLLDEIILRREGGAWFTVTLRQLYKKHYDITIGDYTSYCFRVGNFKKTTSFGRYSDITRTARFETAIHPSNTISVHGIFYQKSLGFSRGLEIPRNRIVVGNDVHIGHNSVFLFPGRVIGDGAIIGAGAVVNFDVPPYAIVAGNPGRIVRYRFDKATIKELLRSQWWDYSLEELETVRDEFIKPLIGKYVV